MSADFVPSPDDKKTRSPALLKCGWDPSSVTILGSRGGKLERARATHASRQDNSRRVPGGVRISVVPAFTFDDSSKALVKTFSGTLKQFCTRRCNTGVNCTAREFGIATPDGSFYTFDDLGNLKAFVLLLDSGKVSGVSVNVSGIVSDTFLTVDQMSLVE